uniref:Uncharacterized protein n=1 Tax=Heterorhabditis bacteriophora TaxID=37862 RepID=A0A1I7XAK9_HETBA
MLFRTMDGTCNNLEQPLRGAAYRPYTRLLPTVYDNELSEPVGMFPLNRSTTFELKPKLCTLIFINRSYYNYNNFYLFHRILT